MNKLKLLLTGLIVLWSIVFAADGKNIICYYRTWSYYRPNDGKFEPSDIDPFLCTHLVYSFFTITPTGEFYIRDKLFDLDRNGIVRTIALKRRNPNLKVIAAVGWNVNSATYSEMAADAEKRQLFIDSAMWFIEWNGFDGLDIGWEYPAQNGGNPEDKVNFITLLEELKEVFVPLNLTLSVSVGATEETALTSYIIANIAELVDSINVNAYDYATARDGELGLNAPLKGQEKGNVMSTINYWLLQGAPANKLALGLAFFGRTFQLTYSQQFTPGSPISGSGSPGPYTGISGFMGYNEICPLERTWLNEWDNVSVVPYIHKNTQWISYDNVESIEAKVDFGLKYNLAGFVVSSIDTDDFRGMCGEKYPLLKAINRKLY